MKLLELFTPDIPVLRQQVLSAIADAKDSKNWNEIERIAQIFARTPYFDHSREKRYVSFTTNEKELNNALADAIYYDDYYIKRLAKRIRGEQ